MDSNRIFNYTLHGFLAVLLLFTAVMLTGMAAYVDWRQWVVYALRTAEGRRMLAGLWFSVKLSVATASITTALALFLGIPAAWVLSRRRVPCPVLVDTILDLPITLPPLVAGVALLTVLRYWLGDFFDALGIQVHYTSRGIVLAQFFIAGPFAVRAVKAAFDDISPRYEAVARTLGCTEFQAFRRVALPLARNGIVAGAVMTWARAVSEFGPILIFCSASEKTAVLPIRVFLFNSAGDITGGVVTSVVLVVIACVALLAFKKLGGRQIAL